MNITKFKKIIAGDRYKVIHQKDSEGDYTIVLFSKTTLSPLLTFKLDCNFELIYRLNVIEMTFRELQQLTEKISQVLDKGE